MNQVGLSTTHSGAWRRNQAWTAPIMGPPSSSEDALSSTKRWTPAASARSSKGVMIGS